MNNKRYSVPMRCLLGALFLLTLGQFLGLFLGAKPSQEAPVTQEISAGPVIMGTVIRREISIAAGEDEIPQKADGVRVAAGETVFAGKTDISQSLWEEWETVRELPLPRRREMMYEILGTVAGKAISPEARDALRALMLAEKSESLPPASKVTQGILAPKSGIFWGSTDGLEEILTPETPWPTISLPRESPKITGGKLVLEDSWYFAAEYPERVKVGDKLPVQVLLAEGFLAEFTVERVELTGGHRRVLFSCETQGARVGNNRNLWVNFQSD